MATFVSDTFTDSTGTNLTAHTGETGATWTAHPNVAGGASQAKIESNRCRGETSSIQNTLYASGAPGSADYTVQADLVVKSNSANTFEAGVIGRVATGAFTFYQADYSTFSGTWRLFKFVAGTPTELGTPYTAAITDEQTYAVKLEMIGTAIKVYVDGVERVSATDSDISAAGKAGIKQFDTMSGVAGLHLDNFVAADSGGGGGSSIAAIVAAHRRRRIA